MLHIVVTGVTDGMGRVAATELARRGARLLLVSRSRERCEAVKGGCVAETGNQQVDYVDADLSTVGEVRRAAAETKGRLDRVDTLVNNAGGTFPKRRTETGEGLELVFMLQYLSRFLLTRELLDQLHASEDPLVMTIAGGGTVARASTSTSATSRAGATTTGSASSLRRPHSTSCSRKSRCSATRESASVTTARAWYAPRR